MKKFVLVAVLCVAGCASLQGSYIEADQKTYNAFKPYMPGWIASVDTSVRADLNSLWYSWGVRVREGVTSVTSK